MIFANVGSGSEADVPAPAFSNSLSPTAVQFPTCLRPLLACQEGHENRYLELFPRMSVLAFQTQSWGARLGAGVGWRESGVNHGIAVFQYQIFRQT